jgi:molybdopterin molybdotransferase
MYLVSGTTARYKIITMVSVTEASAIVLANASMAAITAVPIEEAVGRTLAETVSADRDLPPIDRVTMDGIALSFATWSKGKTAFEVSGIQAAGTPQGRLTQEDSCLEIMTGASLPSGADTVVPYEDIRMEGRTAHLTTDQVVRGQNIHRQGSDALEGTPLLQPGIMISPAEVALLATVGKNTVEVFEFPSTAIVSTGDELVPIGERPEPHQVRRSNTLAILAAMKLMQWPATSFHLPDVQEIVTAQLKDILDKYDVVVLSGGVSKGKFDFIPGALEANGIVKRFHRVNQRPGKPFWFGTSEDGRKTVFALPGNPVSTYLCFYRYVRPWMMKCQQVNESPQYAVLAEDFNPPRGMTYFLQVAVRSEQGVSMAYPDAGGGSGDLANLKDVTGFLEIPDLKRALSKGQVFHYYPFRF